MRKGIKREKVWKQSLYNIAQSRLATLFLLSTCTLIFVLHFEKYFPIVSLIFVIPIAVGFLWYKYIAFEGLLVHHSLFNTLGLFDWYSKVDDNLYLGALVIDNLIFTKLCKSIGINSVVSVVEPFELETTILLGSVITPRDWKVVGIDQIQLPCRDFQPPPFDVLDRGADYINNQIINNNTVYVHCKSGRGRSASVVIAYFMKYRGLNATAAHKKLKASRSVVFDANSRQMKNILNYEVYLKSGK